MAHARQSRFRTGGGSNRRLTGWSAGPRQANPAQITATGAALWVTGAQAPEDGLTVVRLRGMFSCWLEVATAIGDGFNEVAIGICNVTENAFGIGITAVPTPLADMAWNGWLLHMNLGPFISLTTTEETSTGLSMARFEIDSKAMRKTRASDVIIGVIEVGAEQGAATLEFGATTRLLDKLP